MSQITAHSKNWGNLYPQKKIQLADADLKMIQTVERSHKDIKAAVIIIVHKVRKTDLDVNGNSQERKKTILKIK